MGKFKDARVEIYLFGEEEPIRIVFDSFEECDEFRDQIDDEKFVLLPKKRPDGFQQFINTDYIKEFYVKVGV